MAEKSIDVSEVEKKLEDIETLTLVLVKMRMSDYAKLMEGFAKRNRPWTDRTTRARQSLQGVMKEDKIGHTIDVGIAHGVSYGVSLEFEHEKRYAILFPTLRYYTDRIMDEFRHLMERVKI